ncbi:MAG: type II toxin-antitoxin system death-on-curing family toxin [Deltaproteobacteria bacterium]|nr:type II toxin-antitoxin system death-on-curing family toxin [Deltaproteobacteria bacterium]
MKTKPRWIPRQAVIDLHRQQIAEHGGLSGIQKQGSLDSALARPRQIESYGERANDIPALAAAYAWGIAKNHPFVDGNKRMSLICIYVFLGLNGLYLDAREEDAFQAMMELAEGSLDENSLAQWIRSNSLPA